jgi:hypothetical protein
VLPKHTHSQTRLNQIPHAKVRGAPIAGWFFPGLSSDQPSAPWAPPSFFPNWIAGRAGGPEANSSLYDLYQVHRGGGGCGGGSGGGGGGVMIVVVVVVVVAKAKAAVVVTVLPQVLCCCW